MKALLAGLLAALIVGCTSDAPHASEPPLATTVDAVEAAVASGGASTTPGAPAPAKRLKALKADVDLAVGSVEDETKTIKARVEADEGEVLSERSHANLYRAYSAYLAVKVPAAKAPAFLAWLETRGRLLSKSVEVEDVTKPMTDLDERIATLEATIARLRELLKDKSLAVADLIKAEAELRRMMDDLDGLRAAKNQLAARVSFSYVKIDLTAETYANDGGLSRGPTFRMGGVAHSLRFAFERDADDGTRECMKATARAAGAALVWGRAREFSLDVLVAPRQEGLAPLTLLSIGPSFYSYVLGNGTRSFLNPYLSLRAGYLTSRDVASGFAGLDLGLELFKNEWVSLAVLGRGVVPFAQKDLQNLQSAGVELVVPF